jgi:hypothetical protein
LYLRIKMDNIFINSLIISFIFLFIRLLEMRFIIKQNKPFKELFREMLTVYVSIVLGYYLIDQVMPNKNISYEATRAFIGSPEF